MTDKQSRLVTRYVDGGATGLAFIADHQLALRYVPEGRKPLGLLVDLELSAVVPLKRAPDDGEGALAQTHEHQGAEAVAGDGVIELRGKPGAVRQLLRAGKRGLAVRWADDGETLFSASTEVLNRWNPKTGKAQKFKCHDRATHVATTPALIAAQNKEGVICFFDARTGARLVCVRPTGDGWLAFDDTGAFDASAGFGRGAELSWTDAKSTAFVPGEGFGWLELNRFPLSRVVAPTGGKTPGLLALRTKGRW